MRKDLHPVLREYDAIVPIIKDYTKPCQVPVHYAEGKSKVKKGLYFHAWDYEPILEVKDYMNLLKQFDNLPVLISLYELMSFNYFHTYYYCMQWFEERSKVKKVFNLTEQIIKYESKIIDEFSCPIIKLLDLNLLDNINFYDNFRVLIKFAESKNISSVNILLYGGDQVKLPMLPTPRGRLLLKSVLNVTYNRFLSFLNLERDRLINTNVNRAEKNDEFNSIKGRSEQLKNNFNNLSIEEIFKYFYKELVIKKYLNSEETLLEYLRWAFQNKKVPKRKFLMDNIANHRRKITAIFYNFYCKNSSKPYSKRSQYAALLGDYFIGFNTKTILSNFKGL